MPPSPSRPSPSPSPSGRRRKPRLKLKPEPRKRTISARSFLILAAGSVGTLAVAGAVGAWTLIHDEGRGRPARLLAEARAATDSGDRLRAFNAWHAWNATEARTSATLTLEAQMAQAIDRGRDADLAARQLIELDPSTPEPWTIRLNRLRVLDQPAQALEVGLLALTHLKLPIQRRAILKATTLGALAEVPDAEARDQIERWISADPEDIDARVARMARISANPHPGDPDRATRIIDLERIVARDPKQVAAREALTVALADAGEVDRGRAILKEWPDPKDYRFERLQARWNLDYDHQPTRAALGFREALFIIPHDWKLHYGLARSLRILDRPTEAKTEALAVTRLRERLEPGTLGPRLATDFARLDGGPEGESHQAMLDLAALCRSVGLSNLADAWSQAAGRDY